MTDLIATHKYELTALENLGRMADQVAGASTFEDYESRKAANTNRRRRNDLALFAAYLAEKGANVGDLAGDPEAWRGITWGLVKGFTLWLLNHGYAVTSVNMRLSTVKVYAALAAQSGTLSPENLAMIQTVKGYKRSEARHVDELRQEEELPTRIGRKKTNWVALSREQAKALKSQPDTPQGRRDALLLSLLLDLGLRCGEVSALTVDCFDLKAGYLTFFRPKVNKVQTLRLANGLLAAARAYLTNDAPAIGSIWRGSRKGKGGLQLAGMSEQSITLRVRVLGEAAGIHGLSAHDLRHTWATLASRNGTQPDRLMDAGGWTTFAMASRYIEAARIANEGVNLGTE